MSPAPCIVPWWSIHFSLWSNLVHSNGLFAFLIVSLSFFTSYYSLVSLPDCHYWDAGDVAGAGPAEAAELWPAHGGAVSAQYGHAGGAGGWRGLRRDRGGYPGGVLQVRHRALHRDPTPCWWSGGSRLWKGQPATLPSLNNLELSSSQEEEGSREFKECYYWCLLCLFLSRLSCTQRSK